MPRVRSIKIGYRIIIRSGGGGAGGVVLARANSARRTGIHTPGGSAKRDAARSRARPGERSPRRDKVCKQTGIANGRRIAAAVAATVKAFTTMRLADDTRNEPRRAAPTVYARPLITASAINCPRSEAVEGGMRGGGGGGRYARYRCKLIETF